MGESRRAAAVRLRPPFAPPLRSQKFRLKTNLEKLLQRRSLFFGKRRVLPGSIELRLAKGSVPSQIRAMNSVLRKQTEPGRVKESVVELGAEPRGSVRGFV